MLETIHPAQVLTTRQQGHEEPASSGLFAFGDMPWEVGEPKWGYGGRSFAPIFHLHAALNPMTAMMFATRSP
jgi:hypothetical protein